MSADPANIANNPYPEILIEKDAIQSRSGLGLIPSTDSIRCLDGSLLPA